MSEFMSVKRAAKILGYSQVHIGRLLAIGALETVDFEGKRMVGVKSVEDYKELIDQEKQIKKKKRGEINPCITFA